ncbi:MAG TPA: YEATS-associated helix-containing protein [Allosphingosinicella sp.]
MAERFAHLIAIILGAGILGGAAAWLSEPRAGPDDPPLGAPPLRRFLFLGVVAAACVPLFLSLLKSGLIDGIFKAPANAPAYEYYLIFIGLCLIAAVSARRFIDSITAQLIKRLDEVDAKAGRAAAAATEAREVAHEAAAEVEAADDEEGDAPADGPELSMAEPRGAPAEITATERRALEAMTKHSMRTRTGIAEESGISRNRISELLEALADKGLARPTVSKRTGGARWAITQKGKSAIGGS